MKKYPELKSEVLAGLKKSFKGMGVKWLRKASDLENFMDVQIAIMKI